MAFALRQERGLKSCGVVGLGVHLRCLYFSPQHSPISLSGCCAVVPSRATDRKSRRTVNGDAAVRIGGTTTAAPAPDAQSPFRPRREGNEGIRESVHHDQPGNSGRVLQITEGFGTLEWFRVQRGALTRQLNEVSVDVPRTFALGAVPSLSSATVVLFWSCRRASDNCPEVGAKFPPKPRRYNVEDTTQCPPVFSEILFCGSTHRLTRIVQWCPQNENDALIQENETSAK